MSQNKETKEIFGFFAVEGTILARSRYDEASGGFVGRKEIHVTGIRGNWKEIENVVCVPGRTDFVYLLVNDYRKVKGESLIERELESCGSTRRRGTIQAMVQRGGDKVREVEVVVVAVVAVESSSSSDNDNNSDADNNKGDIETSFWKLEVGEAEDAKDS